MAMPEYIDIDFSNRLVALRDVGMAMGVPNASLPSLNGANSPRTYLKFINVYREYAGLGLLPSLDYTGFQPALNVLVDYADPPEPTFTPEVSPLTGPVGTVFTCTQGIWTGMPSSKTYQWRRDGTNIGGATAATYTAVSADSGHTLTCVVTATNAAGTTTAPPSNGAAVE